MDSNTAAIHGRRSAPLPTVVRVGVAVVLASSIAIPAWADRPRRDGPPEARRPPARILIGQDRPAPAAPTDPAEPPDAEPVAPLAPPTQECESLSDVGERLACKAEKTNAEVGRTVESLTAPGAGLLSERQKTFLRDAHDRSERERERTGVDGYKQLAKRREVDCIVKEFDDPTGTDPDDDGDNDGICEGGELCEENDLDQIGDNDSKCETLKQGPGKPIREACVEICDAAAVDADDASYDAAAGLDAEGSFDDGAVLLAHLNERLDTVAFAPPESGAPEASVDADACTGLLDGARQFPYAVLQIGQGAANTLKAIHDGCTDVTRQSTGGFNSSAACVKSAIAMNVVQLVVDAFELQDDSITGTRVDATTSCLELLGTEVQANGDEVDAIALRLHEAEIEIGTRLDELMLLLNTPPGRRSDYPMGTARQP